MEQLINMVDFCILYYSVWEGFTCCYEGFMGFWNIVWELNE